MNLLNVKESYQKQGYGTILLQYAIEDMISRGANTITLVGLTHAGGHRMYKRAGFQPMYPEQKAQESVLYSFDVPENMRKK